MVLMMGTLARQTHCLLQAAPIQDGATTLHTITLAAGSVRDITFPIPLKTSANAALNLNVTVTAGGSLSANAQGFNGV